MDYNLMFKRVENYVTEMFEQADTSRLPYHNLQHTQSVVNRSQEIAAHYNLVESDMLALFIAAWFHDTGYLTGVPLMHEERSVKLMHEFMKDYSSDEDLLHIIDECIMATKAGVEPRNLLQQILVDADTYNLGTEEFKENNKKVLREYELSGHGITKDEWNRKTLELMENHQFFTSYCKELLGDQKKKNTRKLMKKIESDSTDTGTAGDLVDGKQVKATNSFTTKGIQTMLRLTSENHMRLSDMADGKANILISVNAIIISVILSVLMRKLQVETYLTIPTIIFLASSVCTIVVAILATRPKINEGTFSDQDIIDKKTNLLFFGNFYKTQADQYERAMSKMMVDPEYLYTSLVKDIYQLGVVLARKYRLIRWAYNIFMIGIIVSVIAFGLASIFGGGADAVVTNSQGAPL